MTNIYVGNLDFSTSEDELRTLFAAYGSIKTVTAVTDRDTGQPRGFAFVEMTRTGLTNASTGLSWRFSVWSALVRHWK